MPTYEYACEGGGHRFEQFQRFSDEALTKCKVCGAPVRRVIHPAGIILKGGGWYSTDSRSGDAKSKFSEDGKGRSDAAKPSVEPIKTNSDGGSSNGEKTAKPAASEQTAAKSPD